MSKRDFSRTRRDDNMRRYGSEAVDGSSPIPSTPRPRRNGPDLFSAVMAARNRLTDAGVKFALAAAEAGESVVYASDWSPGSENEDKLRAAGVDVVICKARKR